ncbi:hypothetical protein FSP39_000860 [Pinctada imbricata]|uniref:Peptidase S1 domain-containing protein n=1 Tax=Pinctada imbricata TaxID=66713 RepID=A0AA88XWE6_PINIB|nr:hypothetical protein FSP39_000860 [Pinctada imbricata]
MKVIKKNPYNISNDAAFHSNSQNIDKLPKINITQLEILEECILENAPNLWKNHSNLTIITADACRSVDNVPIHEACIVLYCLSKGFVPLSEELFPKELSCLRGKFKTDIREGYFILGPINMYGNLDSYNDPICMGSNIGAKDGRTCGSVGLFVDLPNNAKGFITCCHVLRNCITAETHKYDTDDGDEPIQVQQPGNSAFCGRTDTICAELKKAKFTPNVPRVSVDAALVKLNSRIPGTGHFVIKNITQAEEAGYSQNAYPVYSSGVVHRSIGEDDIEKPLLKSGTSTGLTRSLFRLRGSQVRIFPNGAWLGTNGENLIVMKGQYEVESCNVSKPFFSAGDSGSAVFLKEPNGQLACIGIAIGMTSYHTTVVTPIGSVLDALELSDEDVTRFGT